jgi:hypothetical protein
MYGMGNVEALPYKQEAGLVGQTELYDLVVAPESEVRGTTRRSGRLCGNS